MVVHIRIQFIGQGSRLRDGEDNNLTPNLWRSETLEYTLPEGGKGFGNRETGARHIKKSARHLFARPAMKYPFIAEHRHEFPMTIMCCVLSVSVSGYHAWSKRPPSQHSQEDAQLAEQARSSTPRTRTFPARATGTARTPRSSVVGATCIPSRGASREATSSHVANASATRVSRKRVVRQAYDGTSSGNCSAKILRGQAGLGQKNLRTVSNKVTCRPTQGRSTTCRVYRWTRQACAPHRGKHTLGDDEITWTSSSCAEAVTRSMWSPSDRGRNGDTSILLHLVLPKSFSL